MTFIHAAVQPAGQFAIQNWRYAIHPVNSFKTFARLQYSHSLAFAPAILQGLQTVLHAAALPAFLLKAATPESYKANRFAISWLTYCGITSAPSNSKTTIAKEITCKLVDDVALLAILTWAGEFSKNLPYGGFLLPLAGIWVLNQKGLDGKVITKPVGFLISSAAQCFSQAFNGSSRATSLLNAEESA